MCPSSTRTPGPSSRSFTPAARGRPASCGSPSSIRGRRSRRAGPREKTHASEASTGDSSGNQDPRKTSESRITGKKPQLVFPRDEVPHGVHVGQIAPLADHPGPLDHRTEYVIERKVDQVGQKGRDSVPRLPFRHSVAKESVEHLHEMEP